MSARARSHIIYSSKGYLCTQFWKYSFTLKCYMQKRKTAFPWYKVQLETTKHVYDLCIFLHEISMELDKFIIHWINELIPFLLSLIMGLIVLMVSIKMLLSDLLISESLKPGVSNKVVTPTVPICTQGVTALKDS